MPNHVEVPGMQLQACDASTYLDHMCALDIDSRASYVRLSGIICTIGKYTQTQIDN